MVPQTITLEDGTIIDVTTGQVVNQAAPKVTPVDIEALDKALQRPPVTADEKGQLDPLESVVYNAGHVLVKAGQGAAALPRLGFAAGAGVTNLIQNMTASVTDSIFGTDFRNSREEFGFSKAWEATDVFSPALEITNPVVSGTAKLAGNIAETTASMIAAPGLGGAAGAVVGGVVGGAAQTAVDAVLGDNSIEGAVANVVGAIGAPIAAASIIRKAQALDSLRKLSAGNTLVENEVARFNAAAKGETLSSTDVAVRVTLDDLENAVERLKVVAKDPDELKVLADIQSVKRQYRAIVDTADTEIQDKINIIMRDGVTDEVRVGMSPDTEAKVSKIVSEMNKGAGYQVLDLNTGEFISAKSLKEVLDSGAGRLEIIPEHNGFKVLDKATGEVSGSREIKAALKEANKPTLAVVTPQHQIRFELRKDANIDFSGIDIAALDKGKALLNGFKKTTPAKQHGFIDEVVKGLDGLKSYSPELVKRPAGLVTLEESGRDIFTSIDAATKAMAKSGEDLYTDFVKTYGGVKLDKETVAAALANVDGNSALKDLIAKTRKALIPTEESARHMKNIEDGIVKMSDDALRMQDEYAANHGKFAAVNKDGNRVSAYLDKPEAILSARGWNRLESGHKVRSTDDMFQELMASEAQRMTQPTLQQLDAIRKEWGTAIKSIDPTTKGNAKHVYGAIKTAFEDAIRDAGDASAISAYDAMNSLISKSKKDAALLKEIVGMAGTKETAEFGAIPGRIINKAKKGAETLWALDKLIPETDKALKSKIFMSLLTPNGDVQAAAKIWNQLSPEAKQFYKVKFGDKFIERYNKAMDAITSKVATVTDQGTPTLLNPPQLGMSPVTTGVAVTRAALSFLPNLSATAIAGSPAMTKWVSKFGTDPSAITKLTGTELDKWINAIGYTVRKAKDVEGARLLTALTEEKKSRQ